MTQKKFFGVCVVASFVLLVVIIGQHAASSGRVPVSVMLSLTTIDPQTRQLNNPTQLSQRLTALKNVGVDSVFADVWWGVVEQQPKQYDWAAYLQLVQLVRQAGLKLNVVLSFHQCGGNVGDQCDIPLPNWVRSAGKNAFYTDREGNVDYEYISLGADLAPIFSGRTAVQAYADFMTSFRDNVLSQATDILKIVAVGLGPAGEMRYPSYQFNAYPGVGEFQCYDPYMLTSLQQAAIKAGHPEWGHGGPDNAGSYHQEPEQTGFWSEDTTDNYASDYGRFFLTWYSSALISHGDRILAQAEQIFANKARLMAKIAGVHWLYKTDSHAAECTAGFYNTNGNNGYTRIAQMFASHDAIYDFTCFEMYDSDQCNTCGPQELVQQNHACADNAGTPFYGENALEVYDSRHYSEIEYQSSHPNLVAGFGYLRLSQNLLNNMGPFSQFVNAMNNL